MKTNFSKQQLIFNLAWCIVIIYGYYCIKHHVNPGVVYSKQTIINLFSILWVKL